MDQQDVKNSGADQYLIVGTSEDDKQVGKAQSDIVTQDIKDTALVERIFPDILAKLDGKAATGKTAPIFRCKIDHEDNRKHFDYDNACQAVLREIWLRGNLTLVGGGIRGPADLLAPFIDGKTYTASIRPHSKETGNYVAQAYCLEVKLIPK